MQPKDRYIFIPEFTVLCERFKVMRPNTKLLYMYMVLKRDGRDDWFPYSHDQIRSDSGFRAAATDLAIKQLWGAGFIEYEYGGWQKPNQYYLDPIWLTWDSPPRQDRPAVQAVLFPNLDDVGVAAIQALREELGGMKRPDRMASQHQKYFAELKEHKLALVDYHCEICGYTRRLILHHKHYRSWGTESLDDLCILCNRCHAFVHKRK